MTHIWMSYVTGEAMWCVVAQVLNESCPMSDGVVVPHKSELHGYVTGEAMRLVVPKFWKSNVPQMNESRPTHE